MFIVYELWRFKKGAFFNCFKCSSSRTNWNFLIFFSILPVLLQDLQILTDNFFSISPSLCHFWQPDPIPTLFCKNLLALAWRGGSYMELCSTGNVGGSLDYPYAKFRKDLEAGKFLTTTFMLDFGVFFGFFRQILP